MAAVWIEAQPVPPEVTGRAEPERDKARVPLVVMGEPEIDRKVGTVIATLVTVPEPEPRQTPLMAKQPPAKSTPRAKVEVAVVEVV